MKYCTDGVKPIQSIDQSIHQSINPSLNQSINQSINLFNYVSIPFCPLAPVYTEKKIKRENKINHHQYEDLNDRDRRYST